MDEFASIPYPLEGVMTSQLQTLCEVLWGWNICSDCKAGQLCQIQGCGWQRSARLEPFFEFYKEATSSYVPEELIEGYQALRTHEDLFEIINTIKKNPHQSRSAITRDHFASRSAAKPSVIDQNRGFNLALRVIAMVNCSIENQSLGMLESGAPKVWRSDRSVASFIQSAFPIRDHPGLRDLLEGNMQALAAKGLKRNAGLKFKATDDLRNHLRLDQETGVVEIYHHTTVLKEQLLATKDSGKESLPVPRALALETLGTIQMVLFPYEPESQALLRSLVSKQGFDPDCLRFGTATYRRPDEANQVYQYWGSRLMDLYDEIENPKPRGVLETWLERRSKSRHVMLATLAGVSIAIILGILSLAVGIFQAWVAYQQWKYPTSTG